VYRLFFPAIGDVDVAAVVFVTAVVTVAVVTVVPPLLLALSIEFILNFGYKFAVQAFILRYKII
jgi:hypothetical protein